jgi:thiamine kinase-like enzyme
LPHTALLERIERLLGQHVEQWTPVVGGYTPATRLRCRTAMGSVFAKAGATPLTAQFLRREIQVYQRIHGPFVPKLLGYEDHETEPLLLIEDLSEAHWPPPWSERHVERVLEQTAVMHATAAPELESYARTHSDIKPGWERVAAKPEQFLSLGLADAAWLETALPVLLDAERRCETEGEALCHFDLRSDNLCLLADRVLFVDWNSACRANPQLDLGFWLPSLHYEGGPPPERILPDAPAVAAFVAGYFAARAGQPDIPDAPRVRRVQREQLSTALPWAIRALDLPRPRNA